VQQHPPDAQAAGFGASDLGQYSDLNQPAPLREKDVEEIIFSTSEPHSGQEDAGGSENFWRSSKW
jgi:hypothetical protein